MNWLIADVNELALAIFAVVVAITLIVTYFASKRVSTATDFWAAGRGLTGPQNGFAIAGDYMSAASFLGIAGLIFLFGFDGFLYSVGFLVAFLTVLFLLAERMRNCGKYTIADVLSFRMKRAPARAAAALGTLSVVAFYLIAQMVGAGVLIQALVGIDFWLAVVLTGAFMLIYIVAGGMLATTWVQIIKAVLLMTRDDRAVDLRARRRSAGTRSTCSATRAASRPRARPTSSRACSCPRPLDTVSLGIGLVLGTAGLPHILMRFFTVPDAKAARVVGDVGDGPDRRLLRDDHRPRLRRARDPRAGRRGGGRHGRQPRRPLPRSSAATGRRRRPVPGDHRRRWRSPRSWPWWPGLVISASGAVAHDVWSNIVRKGKDSEKEEVWVAKIAAVSIGAIAIAIAVIGGAGLNVSFMVGLAFAVAASANFPALLLALTWRRFNTTGAVTGVLFGVISSIALVIISPTVWPGAGLRGRRAVGWYSLANPAIICVPLGFIGCWLGTMLSTESKAVRCVRRAVRALGDGPRRRDRHRPDAHGPARRAAHGGSGDVGDTSPVEGGAGRATVARPATCLARPRVTTLVG